MSLASCAPPGRSSWRGVRERDVRGRKAERQFTGALAGDGDGARARVDAQVHTVKLTLKETPGPADAAAERATAVGPPPRRSPALSLPLKRRGYPQRRCSISDDLRWAGGRSGTATTPQEGGELQTFPS